MITTYKGQSGSPLFLRIKNEKLKEIKKEKLITNPNEKYSYLFLGLHSRSPDLIESIDFRGKNKSFDFSRNNNFNNFNSNKKTIDINIDLFEKNNAVNNIDIKFKEIFDKGNPEEINNFLINNLKYFLKDQENLYEKDKQKQIDDFIKKNYYCSYNVGLKINKKIYEGIKKDLKEFRRKNNNNDNIEINNFSFCKESFNDIDNNNNINYPNRRMTTEEISNLQGKHFPDNEEYLPRNSIDYKIEYEEKENPKKDQITNNNIINNLPTKNNFFPNDENNYFLINFFIYNDFIFKGIFNFSNKFSILFEIASQYLDIDKEFLQIQIDEKKYNINSHGEDYINLFFNNKNDSENLNISNSNIFRKIIYFNFSVDIESYSEVISKKLISELNDNVKNFDIDKEINNIDENLNIILKYIFNEIQFLLEKSTHLHGLLFNSIKDRILFYKKN